MRFVIEATQKRSSFSALCAAYEISRPTGYLWLRRYRQQGVDGIAERSRKPHYSPRRTDGDSERRVTELRSRYPDWGARKLQVLLAREGVQLPRNTIHHILRRRDLIGAQPPARRRQRSGSSVSAPTNFGRWTSRARKDGLTQWDRCRCSTIIAAT